MGSRHYHVHGSPRVTLRGEEFSIIPQCKSNSAFGATRFPTNVGYIISSGHHSLTWLGWNDETAGFRGVVPMYSETPGNEGHFTSVARSYRGNPCIAVEKLCIEVKAILTDENDSVVRYERIVRAHLTLNIVPWFVKENAQKPSDMSTGPNIDTYKINVAWRALQTPACCSRLFAGQRSLAWSIFQGLPQR